MQVTRASKSRPLLIADPLFGEPGTIQVARAGQPYSREKHRSITSGHDLSDVYFAPLAGTAQEVSAIQSLFPDAKVLMRQQASKSALKQVEAPQILHIATHGFFLQNTAHDQKSASGRAGARVAGAANKQVQIENPLLRSGLALPAQI